MVYAMRSIGCGQSAMSQFCSTMNMPPPVSLKPFMGHTKALLQAAKDVAEQISLSTNLDPDLNFYATSPYTCNYMVENEISKLATVKQGNSDFSLLHLNCRSLLGYFDDFKALIANLHESFCAIGISETWLNDQTFDCVNLPGHRFISNHRSGKTGGGVGLYLQDIFNINYFKIVPYLILM